MAKVRQRFTGTVNDIKDERCTCNEAWKGHPNPHAITCPKHETVQYDSMDIGPVIVYDADR